MVDVVFLNRQDGELTTEALEGTLLTPSEVAAKLRVRTKTVYRAIESGRLRGFRLGEAGSLRVPVDAVEESLHRAHDDEGER